MPAEKIEGGELAATILDGVAAVSGMVAPFATGGAGVAIQGVAGIASLVARLVRAGVHPQEAIHVWASAIPDVRAANDRIDALIKERSGS